MTNKTNWEGLYRVQFKDWLCILQRAEYAKGGTAIRLIEEETYEPVATCTLWVEGLAEDEIAIKNYTENEGMLECLFQSDVIEWPHRFVMSGLAVVPITKLK